VKILVADDEVTSRLLTEMAVRALGYRCTVVNDGAAAWDSIRNDRPDVVISDWAMPRLNGIQLCRNIRADSAASYVYFIMVSAQGTVDDVLEGMSAGVDDYLVKPLNPDELRARLISAARVSSLHRDLDDQRAEMRRLNLELSAIARRDPLTDLGNRLGLREDLELLEARATRYGHRYCMALIDVDHFKSYNDHYGHQAGDEALQAVSEELKEQARSGDALYRYGGDEFLCILPEQSLAGGEIAVERMRTGVERLAIPHAAGRIGVLTVSAGVAVLGSRPQSVAEVLKEADGALYRAKAAGRNRSGQLAALRR
jgi:two-component system cell cycle response regulator